MTKLTLQDLHSIAGFITNEVWKNIEGYNGKYQISSLGRVKSFLRYPNGKILAGGFHKGYQQILLYRNGSRKTVFIHRLVAEAFLVNEYSKYTVNHINGVKSDNRLRNLEWATVKENINHACSKGLRSGSGFKKGSENSNSKLTESEVKQIRSEYENNNTSYNKLSLKYNVSASTIELIIRRLRWKHV